MFGVAILSAAVNLSPGFLGLSAILPNQFAHVPIPITLAVTEIVAPQRIWLDYPASEGVLSRISPEHPP